jgi:MAF protein
MIKKEIILGTSSQIRKMILESSGYPFKSFSPNIDETLYEYLSPVKKVKKIALEKNIAIAQKKKFSNSIIITADTLCLLSDGSTLPKPINDKESLKMSMLQSGKTITAITGVCISFVKNKNRVYINKNSSTKVRYIKFSEKDIKILMQKFKTNDKASGLGIFSDSIGFTLIEKINGSYTGAFGLPMEIVRNIIEKYE